MTACVVTVLLMPTTIPEAITQTISAHRTSVNRPMSTSGRAKKPSAPYNEGAVPNRACSRGAPITAKKATSRPQPKKTNPSWTASSSIGYGAYPSIVKKPQL
jgi:hypothetical protein